VGIPEVTVISGVYVPLLTAFAGDGGVDSGACAEHARWLVNAQVDGLVPFGTSGEGPSVSVREKLATLTALFAAVPGTPIIPAITESSLDTALQLAEAVNDLPAAGLLLQPPFYFRPLSEEALRRYTDRVLAVSAHPVLLYHIPDLAPAVPLQAVADLPVWGVKDSSGDLTYTRAVLTAGKGVMVGAEHTIVAAIEAGAQGTIAGLANVLPEHLLAAVAAARAGDSTRATRILGQALAFRDQMLAGAGPLDWLPLLKRLAHSRHGVNFGPARPPVPDVSADRVSSLIPHLQDVLAELQPGSALA
jgi:4-hydroxy-tetrahydrodipicolinate synthase